MSLVEHMESFKSVSKTGSKTKNGDKSNKVLQFLYKTASGRLVLKLTVRPFFSRIGGKILSTRISALKIRSFIKKAGIDMSEYEQKRYKSFNEFFTRKILPDKRHIDMEPQNLISPCDGKLSAYHIGKGSVFNIKGWDYTVQELLCDDLLAQRYEKGICLIFRLCVDDYHRYCYIDGGCKGENIHINGELHTVQPIAQEKVKVFARNDREYTVLDTDHFGIVTQIEIGALMVGKITNWHGAGRIEKGQEKGCFEFGGSTIVLLLEENAVEMDKQIFDDTENGLETAVKLGQTVAKAGVSV